MTPSSGNAVRPPKRHYRRPCSWETFEKLFDPIIRDEESVLWEPWEVPRDADARYWWTVFDCNGRLLLCAGFHFVDRLGYIRCVKPWGGDWSEHPEYLY